MGFSDSLKKAFEVGFKSAFPKTKKEKRAMFRGSLVGAASGNVFSQFSAVAGERLRGESGSGARFLRTSAGLLAPGITAGERLQRPEERDKISQFFNPKDEPDLPIIAKRSSPGSGTIKAKSQARQRALNEAARRRGLGLGGTIRTSPLGLQGDGATTSRRRLIGE